MPRSGGQRERRGGSVFPCGWHFEAGRLSEGGPALAPGWSPLGVAGGRAGSACGWAGGGAPCMSQQWLVPLCKALWETRLAGEFCLKRDAEGHCQTRPLRRRGSCLFAGCINPLGSTRDPGGETVTGTLGRRSPLAPSPALEAETSCWLQSASRRHQSPVPDTHVSDRALVCI